jgi:hypothetical protein
MQNSLRILAERVLQPVQVNKPDLGNAPRRFLHFDNIPLQVDLHPHPQGVALVR